MALLWSNGAATSELELAQATQSLEDVLAFDPRDAETACAKVDFSDRSAATHTPSDRIVPPNPDGVTPIGVFMFVLAVSEIETDTNSFRFEGYGGLIWCDPRLAFDPATYGSDRRLVLGEHVASALQEIWWPGVFLPTQLGIPDRNDELLLIFADGTVRYRGKFYARVTADYDFTYFPMDRQTLRIPIQTNLWSTEQVVFREIQEQIGFNRGFEIQEWSVLNHRTRVEQLTTSRGDRGFARFVLEIEIGRKVGFYLWKVCLPLVIILGVSLSVFWMTGDALAQRQRQAATGVLTLVAFQFVAAETVPRVPYLTLMDAVVLWTFLIAASTLVVNVVNGRRFRKVPELGRKADRTARWVYPTVYAAGVLVILARRLL
jgi:hypothetical protein